MKTLDAHGDDYRNAQLTILLEASLENNAMFAVIIVTTVVFSTLPDKWATEE